MKKQVLLVLLAVFGVVLTCGSVMAETEYDANVINKVNTPGSATGHSLTTVEASGDYVIVTLTNVRVGPIGKNTNGEGLTTPAAIALFSGIMDAANQKQAFVVAPVKNGTATFRIPNTALVAGVAVVEHLWGRSADGKLALVHDPEDPFVVSNKGDLNTLAIGIVMQPNRSVESLKTYGKLAQGKHPELTKR